MITIKHRFLQLILQITALLILASCASSSDKAPEIAKMDDDIQEEVNIAIMTPLSGPNEELGRQYSRLIKMGITDGASTKIRLFSYDSGSDLALEESLDKMVDQDIDIIIGPILSADTKKVASRMKNRAVIIVSLSNDPSIADKNIFIMGHAPMKQLTKLTDYFLKNNYKNYLLLLPQSNYSTTSGKILQDQIQGGGGKINKIEFYGNSIAEIDRATNAISDEVDTLNEIDTNLTRPVVLIADDPFVLSALFAGIKKYNLDKKAIIAGDNRLDIGLPNQIDSVYTGSWNIASTGVKQKAMNFGIKNISFMHAIAYDAGKIVAMATGERYSQEQFLTNMSKFHPFIGISGNIHFDDSTIADREYDLIKREDFHEKAIYIPESEIKK